MTPKIAELLRRCLELIGAVVRGEVDRVPPETAEDLFCDVAEFLDGSDPENN